MNAEKLEQRLAHKLELEERKEYKHKLEQAYEDELEELDLPHSIQIQLHRRNV